MQQCDVYIVYKRPSGRALKPGTLEVDSNHCMDRKRNCVGIILKYSKSVLEVKRVFDRMTGVKLEIQGVIMKVISPYVLQVGWDMERKEHFWTEFDEMVEGMPKEESGYWRGLEWACC